MAQLAFEHRKPPGARRTIVIVEAPGSQSLRIRQIAASAGFRVVSATSGPMLQSYALKSAPDLILLTPQTGPPGPSEIARAIKENASTRDIPVLQFMGSRQFEEDSGRAYPTEAVLPTDAAEEEILRTLRVLTSRAPRVRRERGSGAPLEGDLESDTFPEVLQFLFATGKTGRIVLREGAREGMICLEEGRVVHAELGELSGLAAFRRMCFSQRGWFRFEPGVRPPRRSMRADGIGLLLESARQKDLADRTLPPATRTARLKAAPHPRPELFRSATEDPDTARSIFGIAILVALVLLLAYGVYAWSGS